MWQAVRGRFCAADAQAFGTSLENALLAPVVDATQDLRAPDTVITADAGYHSKAGLEHLAKQGVSAFIADNDYRKRDTRYDGQDHYKDTNICICPVGKRMRGSGKPCQIKDYMVVKFQGANAPPKALMHRTAGFSTASLGLSLGVHWKFR